MNVDEVKELLKYDDAKEIVLHRSIQYTDIIPLPNCKLTLLEDVGQLIVECDGAEEIVNIDEISHAHIKY